MKTPQIKIKKKLKIIKNQTLKTEKNSSSEPTFGSSGVRGGTPRPQETIKLKNAVNLFRAGERSSNEPAHQNH